MALIACPGCGAPMWDEANACPTCARPFQPVQRKKGLGGVVILLIIAGLALLVLPILATLAIYGVRRYIENAKTAEARNALGQLAHLAVGAYERNGQKRICPSASRAVPVDRKHVSGMKYMSARSDWKVDAQRNAGFSCLNFELTTPQYFQYEYEATPSSFTIRAHGDLNGDGEFSTYEIGGTLVGDQLVIEPDVRQVSAE